MLTQTNQRDFSISLCTTCMGRLDDLMQTLPKNLADSSSYGPLEFVLLDYNSPDGLEQWARESLGGYIESGRLTYARITTPQWYSMTHSRNVAFKLARNEIVCNVDADNWIGSGFVERINELAREQPEHAIFMKGPRLLRGRVGFYRSEWEHLLGGYDEEFEGYGHDDRDLVTRAEALGFTAKFFGKQYIHRLPTSSADKVRYMCTKDWRKTESMNKRKSAANLQLGKLKANAGRPWGSGEVRINFQKTVLL